MAKSHLQQVRLKISVLNSVCNLLKWQMIFNLLQHTNSIFFCLQPDCESSEIGKRQKEERIGPELFEKGA